MYVITESVFLPYHTYLLCKISVVISAYTLCRFNNCIISEMSGI